MARSKDGAAEPRLRIVGTGQNGEALDARPLPATPERHGDLGSGPEVSPFDRPGGDEGNCRPTGLGVVEDADVDQG